MESFLRIALVLSALLFVSIQVVLVTSVFKFPQRVSRHDSSGVMQDNNRNLRGQELPSEAADSPAEEGEIVIKRRWELLWTVTPLVASLALFMVSYWVLSG